eukprot:TRINITY_DN7962_c0_g1_i1.p1 TRINITY_DN7962_c0_g1~~TRINITY_DN7962_c0_g1_i1.p1  ORF type:complete len:323 (-),score=36.65 TRINITY_DN7962_c0_g1_i1:76-1044(-)
MALKVALKLDLFSLIKSGSRTIPELSKITQATEKGLQVLLDYLVVSTKWIEKKEDQYFTTESSELCLTKDSDHTLVPFLSFLFNDDVMESIFSMENTVRNSFQGKSVCADTLDAPWWTSYASFTSKEMKVQAPMTLDVINLSEIDKKLNGGKMKVLDLASGNGAFGLEVLRRSQRAEVYAVDYASVLEVANKIVEKGGPSISSRWNRLPGSAFEIDYGTDYDLVLVTNFFMHFKWDRICQVFKKIYNCLKPGGRLIIRDMITNNDGLTPVGTVKFGLVISTTSDGACYKFGEYEKHLIENGFGEIKLIPLPITEQVIYATKI